MSLLKIENVSLCFPRQEKPILSGISYLVNQGDFIIILGSNGSGKSSLLKLISQRYQPSIGTIYFENKSLKNYSVKQFSRHIKTLTQNCHESLFTSLTVLENYLLVKQQYEPHLFATQDKREREFFANYLLQFNPNLAAKLDCCVDFLSGGEKQTLALALTVLYPPRILLLDEHTSALDPKTAESIMLLTKEIVQRYQITCLLTTHDLSQAKDYGSRVLALKNGTIHQAFEYDTKRALSKTQLLAACY
jgi:putative ABC transport system ATP-binding protein